MENSNNPSQNLQELVFSLLLPIMALTKLSHTGDKFWHLGPQVGLAIALALPIGYGIYFFSKTRKFSMMSVLGLVSVLATGLITIYLWNKDGTIKPEAPLLFGAKEAIIPLILGAAILLNSKLFKSLFYQPAIFNIELIEEQVNEKQQQASYVKALQMSLMIFAGSFFLSAVLNWFVAQYFLSEIDYNASDSLALYNAAIAKITGWGFLIIGVPAIITSCLAIFFLIKQLKAITGLSIDDILHAQETKK